jgi:hypothetical protein
MYGLPPHLMALLDQTNAAVRDIKTDAPLARQEGRCIAPPNGCGQPIGPLATAFRDRTSRAEYGIVGLCQRCQDAIYAPDADETAAMAANPEHYGRCGDCGEYRPYEFVDIGVGVIKGFDCCNPWGREPRPLQCTKTDDAGRPCVFAAGHVHGCEFPTPRSSA